MAQIILTFGLEKEKLRAVRSTALKNGMLVKEILCVKPIPKTRHGIQGFHKEKTNYIGPDFPLEMMVFSGTDSTQMDAFLADYKQTGAASIPLKAIITPHNIFWTAEALYQELFKEHLRFI